MVLAALLLLLQGVPQSMLATADDANEAYVKCLFATSRAASASHLSVEAFEARLGSACTDEEAALVRAMANVLQRRGESNATAQAERAAKDARRSVVETYRRAIELKLN